mmetsp:Transcript_36390/g.58403  ORF Transcript_36390/g.58403 Transcript_36390/m.58403 type:complete len:88 (+) Transcript_36390:154-417(+)
MGIGIGHTSVPRRTSTRKFKPNEGTNKVVQHGISFGDLDRVQCSCSSSRIRCSARTFRNEPMALQLTILDRLLILRLFTDLYCTLLG